MANKHDARESGTKPAVWARSEPGTIRFYAGPGRIGTNKRARIGQETRHGGQARCWGPSAFEGPQKRNLTIFSKRNM
jgi:hypothetical protein